jgi:hypothetical protein
MASDDEYFARLRATTPRIVRELKRRGIDERYLSFGGPGKRPQKQPRVPTDARSEFLANRAMGDWAEDLLASAIEAIPEIRAVHYGDRSKMAAGDSGFKEFYLGRIDDVRLYGKRPDLLVVPSHSVAPTDVSEIPTSKLAEVVSSALGAIEVRSSKFEALTYARVRAEDRLRGIRSGRESLGFAVKVEDLIIVYRWIEKYHKPQIYVQVFFDAAFAINFATIFEMIAKGDGYKIETPAKSQLKSTIMIPITNGVQVGSLTTTPRFEAEVSVTRLGRHDAYVKPVGGLMILDRESLLEVLRA